MPQHLPHVFPQRAGSKNEEQLLHSLPPERLRSPAELTQQSGIERVVHLQKRQPEGVFHMRSVEVLRWKVVRWLQLQPTHYSFMALIYWTDRDRKNTNTQKHTTQSLPWQNGNFDHQGTKRAGAHVLQLRWERQALASLPGSLQCERLSALCHIPSCCKCVQGGAHLNTLPFKASEPFSLERRVRWIAGVTHNDTTWKYIMGCVSQ